MDDFLAACPKFCCEPEWNNALLIFSMSREGQAAGRERDDLNSLGGKLIALKERLGNVKIRWAFCLKIFDLSRAQQTSLCLLACRSSHCK